MNRAPGWYSLPNFACCWLFIVSICREIIWQRPPPTRVALLKVHVLLQIVQFTFQLVRDYWKEWRNKALPHQWNTTRDLQADITKQHQSQQ